MVQWLRFHLPMQGVKVRSLVEVPRSHVPCGQKTKAKNRNNVTNLINTLKTVHVKKNLKKLMLIVSTV